MTAENADKHIRQVDQPEKICTQTLAVHRNCNMCTIISQKAFDAEIKAVSHLRARLN